MDRLDLSSRRLIWVGLAIWQLLLGLLVYRREPSDWFIFEAFGRGLLGRGPRTPVGTGWQVLHVYAQIPRFQVGPPALLTGLPFQLLPLHLGRPAAAAVMAASGLLVLGYAAGFADRTTTKAEWRLLLLGALFIPPWTVLSVKYLHLDDVLTLLLVVAAARAVAADRWVTSGLLLGTAAAAKPWAVVCGGLLLALSRATAVRALCLAVLTAVLWWAPFLLADAGTGSALLGTDVPVSTSSLPGQLGVKGSSAFWFRPLQLSAVAAAAALYPRKPAQLLLVALTLRCLLDVQVWPYYWAGPAVGAAVAALAGVRAGWPILVVSAAAAAPTIAGHYGFVGEAQRWALDGLLLVLLAISPTLGRPVRTQLTGCEKLLWGSGSRPVAAETKKSLSSSR